MTNTFQVGFGRAKITPEFGVPLGGYIPNTHAYDYGCYESHTSNFARDTGDELVQTYTAMLQDLRN